MFLEPALRLTSLGVKALDMMPECAAMIEMREMREFMYHDVVAHGLGHQSKAPVEHDPASASAAAPACSGIAAHNAGGYGPHRDGMVVELRGQGDTRMVFQEAECPGFEALDRPAYREACRLQ